MADGATVRLTYERPLEWIYPPGVFEVGGASTQYSIREYSQGMIIRLVMGDSIAKWAESGTVTWIDGADAGKPVVVDVTTTNVPKYLASVTTAERRLPITAAMTAPGSMLFGLPNLPAPALESDEESGLLSVDVPRTATDLLEFTSASGAVFSGSKEAVTRKVEDNWLYVTHANGKVWRYALLTQNDATGRQAWLAEFPALQIKRLFMGFTPPAPRLVFTPELATRGWNSSNGVIMNGMPKSDGTLSSLPFPASTHNGKWEISPAGDLIITYSLKSTGAVVRSTRYVPIKFIGEQLWLLTYDIHTARTSSSTTAIGYIEKRLPAAS